MFRGGFIRKTRAGKLISAPARLTGEARKEMRRPLTLPSPSARLTHCECQRGGRAGPGPGLGVPGSVSTPPGGKKEPDWVEFYAG